jgi:hypothetical protein
MPIIPQTRVREIRDLMLLYLHDHGGQEKMKHEIAIDHLKKALNLSDSEYLAGYNNLQARRLLQFPGTPNHIGINLDGQFEVETLVISSSNADGHASGIANLRELSMRMAAQSKTQEKLQAELDAYRRAPWWQRLFAVFGTATRST